MKKVLETLAQIHGHAAESTEGVGGGARKRKKEGSEGGQQGKREKQGVV